MKMDYCWKRPAIDEDQNDNMSILDLPIAINISRFHESDNPQQYWNKGDG